MCLFSSRVVAVQIKELLHAQVYKQALLVSPSFPNKHRAQLLNNNNNNKIGYDSVLDNLKKNNL